MGFLTQVGIGMGIFLVGFVAGWIASAWVASDGGRF